ncbi:P-selectin-like [Littorina saxatilis]|uniref:P-selectin-like n=1 Tax=Littorina saxatilis TaxID=31220 RepID=UPI0038B59A38
MNRLPAFPLLLLFVLCYWVTGGKSGLPEDVCSDQKGSQNRNGFCKQDEQFEDTDCFETDAVQCPQGRLLGEGSVCLNRTAVTVLSTCRLGGWVTDGTAPVLHREKRWVLPALAIIAPAIPSLLKFVSSIFGGRDSSDQPPPNRPPQIQCPADIVVVAEEGKTTAVVTWQTPQAGDPDGKAFVVQQLTGLGPGSEFPRGTDSISYRVRDAHGAADFCGFLVTVKVIECPETPYVTGGNKKCRPSQNIYGSVCDYTCKTGFKLRNGVSRTKCQQDRSWTHEFPSCHRLSCGSPKKISGGQAFCRSEEYGGLCPIHCHPGFSSQTPFIRCTSDGTWTQALPCLDMQAPTFPNGCPSNQVLRSGPLLAPVTVPWVDPVVRDNSGLEVRLKSDVAKGDKLAVGSHVIKISAMDAANNSASCSFVVTVEAKGCRPPVTPANSHITCTHGYVQGSQCKVTCDHGYQLLGNATVTCVDEDTWNNVEPSCEIKQCPEPPQVDHGRYECKNGWSYRDSCSLICHPSYDVSGPSDVMCRDDATWSETATCRDNTPPVFPDGCVDDIEVYAARLGEPTFVDWGTPTVEDNTRENVILSSSIEPGSQFNLGVSPVTYTAVDINSNKASCHFTVTVSSLSCGAPNLHQNSSGNFMLFACRDGYVHGAECTLSCTHGFPLNGPRSIACERADNSFPPTMTWEWDVETGKPECIETRCKDLTAPTNGALACYTGNFGKECLMSCQENWDVPASSNGRFACPNDKGIWVPEVVPNCIARQVPGRIRLLPDLYYYANSCSEATEELKQNFIDRILSSEWGGACSQTPSCTAQNVQVMVFHV